MKKPKIPICPYCEHPSQLVNGVTIYPHRPDLATKHFYLCKPCDAYVGCHPGTQHAMGRLANAELRKAKKQAHATFDPIWKQHKFMRRSAAYLWLSQELGIKEDVIAMLLPRAFSKRQFTAIWINTKLGYIYVDAGSAKRAEDALALLRKSLGSLPVVPLTFNSHPSEIMTSWLKYNEVPDWLTLQEEGRLKSIADNSEATFRHQDLESDEIETHLDAGKYVSRLALDWENHLSFTLNEDGSLSKIKFADDIREKNDDILKEDVAQRFDADFYLMTQELSRLINNLTTEFYGVKERE